MKTIEVKVDVLCLIFKTAGVSVFLSYWLSVLPLQDVDWGGSRTAAATVMSLWLSFKSIGPHDLSSALTTQ